MSDKTEHEWEEFSFKIDELAEDFIERGWSEKKVARNLREKARYLDPPKKIHRVNPLTCSEEDFSKLRPIDQEKFSSLRKNYKKVFG